MDVTRRVSLISLFIALASCGNPKTANTVFNENTSLDSKACAGESIQNKFIVEWEDGHFTVEYGDDVPSFKENFIKPQLALIRSAENDRRVKFQIHTDTVDNNLRDVSATAVNDTEWGQYKIAADKVWAKGFFGQGVKVGVVDTNVDSTHPQISPRLKDLHSFISTGADPANPSPHGTHVSGIIAADPNFGDLHGVASRADIYAAPFLGDDGTGDLGDGISAMQYVASKGVKVINASWGGSACIPTLQKAFNQLSQQGILLVVAAGNGDQYGNPIDLDINPFYPAAFGLSNEITVAATTPLDMLTSWSNNGFKTVHLGAPGSNIVSTVPTLYDSSGYHSLQGTSMAAPFVTGAAALLMSAQPTATAAQIKKALLDSVDVNNAFYVKVLTRGRMNVDKALTELNKNFP